MIDENDLQHRIYEILMDQSISGKEAEIMKIFTPNEILSANIKDLDRLGIDVLIAMMNYTAGFERSNECLKNEWLKKNYQSSDIDDNSAEALEKHYKAYKLLYKNMKKANSILLAEYVNKIENDLENSSYLSAS